MSIDISISVVLFNSPLEEIENIISSFKNLTLRYKLLFVDNSPVPLDSFSFESIENVEYIFSGNNKGFGSGHNIAINKIINKSKYHIILNADVDFKTEIINEMFYYMESNSDIGLLAPKVLNPDNTIQYSCKLLPTPANLLVRRFIPLQKVKDYFDYKYEFKFTDFNQIIEVPFVMGCFMFIRTEVFSTVGVFDERYFMYLEDIDLSRRIHEKYKTLFYPNVHIHHKHGRGSYTNTTLLKYHVNATFSYFNKWGWFIDKGRTRINNKILSQFKNL